MMIDPSGEDRQRSEAERSSDERPRVVPISEPESVPLFSCIVYVSRLESGGVRARVANLPGLEFQADSERAALAKVVPAFKDRVRELTESKTAIPWIDPPLQIEPHEQQRLIPVHL